LTFYFIHGLCAQATSTEEKVPPPQREEKDGGQIQGGGTMKLLVLAGALIKINDQPTLFVDFD
jgi:hypothetical protein